MDVEDQAVSEIIGTLALVGIVVIGIVLAALLLFSHPAASRVPVFNSLISNQSSTIYIYHKGGDSLNTGEYRILVDGVDRTQNFTFVSPGTEPWSVGETLSYTSPTMPGQVVIVFTGNNPGGGTVIGQSDLHPVLDVPLHLPNYPMVAWSSSPAFGNITTLFQFTDASSVDNLTSYFWNFNDANTSTVKSPSHVFPCAPEYCTYEIDHSVTDSGGTGWAATSWLNRSAWITVYKNLTPTVTFTNTSATGMVSLTVTFNATQVGAIRVDTWSWTFGDGGTSNLQNVSYTYSNPGHYTVNLTATNYTLGVTTVTKSNLVTATPNPPWYSCSWGYRKKITIDHTKVSADLVGFPVLINPASDADLSASARTDAFDILFTQSDGTTKIFHEIENFTKSSGALTAWVNISSLSSTTDTVLYLYYGYPSSGDQQTRISVWDSNFKAVWHLGELVTDEASSGSHLDSTSNANTALQRKNGPVTGKIGLAQFFDGNDYILGPNSASLGFTTDLTVEAWVNLTNANQNQKIVGKTNDLLTGRGWVMGVQTFGLYPEVWNAKATPNYYTFTSGSINNAQWTHLVFNFKKNSLMKGYVNGAQVNSIAVNNNNIGTATMNLTIGAEPWNAPPSQWFANASIDEVRLSNTIRSADWILTEYRNQNSPDTFSTNGTQLAWTC